MSEEKTSENFTYINGQKVYDEDYMEPLVPPLPKSPINSSIELTAFLTEQIALAHSSNINLAEQNAFIVEELAATQVSNKQLAEQQAAILLLLAEQTTPPDENPDKTETPSETPVEDNPEEVEADNPEEESPIADPIEENIPEEGDGQ